VWGPDMGREAHPRIGRQLRELVRQNGFGGERRSRTTAALCHRSWDHFRSRLIAPLSVETTNEESFCDLFVGTCGETSEPSKARGGPFALETLKEPSQSPKSGWRRGMATAGTAVSSVRSIS
jgi:hypothetical protein